MRRDPWTEEKTQQLASLLEQGKSYREIAEIFGTTRNAIIGKVQRERIKRGHSPEHRKRILEGLGGNRISPELLRHTTPKRTYTFRSQPKPSTEGIGFILPAIAAPAPRTGPAVGLLDVTGCKWPVAEDASLIGGKAFCNHTKADGKPYCPYHVNASIAPYSAELKRRTFKSLQFLLKRAA
jgi:hypothetical protein